MADPGMTTTRVVLVRHAQASYETSGNGDSGGSLTRAGRDQAGSLGARLASFRPTVVLCSELSRAVQTAEIAASTLAIPVEVRVGLEEYDVGDMKGLPYDPDVFEPLLSDWRDGRLSASVPGGEDGLTVATRMFAVLEDAAARFPGKTLAVVSHGGAINAVLGAVMGGGDALPDDALELPACGMVVLKHRDEAWQVLPIARDPLAT